MIRFRTIELGKLIAHSRLNELGKPIQKLFELLPGCFIFERAVFIENGLSAGGEQVCRKGGGDLST